MNLTFSLKLVGIRVTGDTGSLAFREPDESLGLPDMDVHLRSDSGRGRNKRRQLVLLLRQSIYSRLGEVLVTPNMVATTLVCTMRLSLHT